MSKDTVGSLAALVGGELHGDPDRPITGVADLREAGPEEIGFLTDMRLVDAARTSRAGALLVKRVVPTDAAQILVENVYAAFARVASHFHPVPRASRHRVDRSALLGEGVELEEPVEIGPGCVIEEGTRIGAGTLCKAGVLVGAGCKIGRDCVLYPGVILYPGVTLGDRVLLHGGCVVGADGFGYAREENGSYVKFPQLGSVILEDDVEIGANTTIDRGALGNTRVGRGSKIDNLVMVAHNCDFGEDVAIAGFCGFSGSTVLGDRVSIGGHVVSSGHIKIGKDIRIGGATVLYRDVSEPGDYLGYPLLEKRRWMRTLRAMEGLLELREEVRNLRKRMDEQAGS